MEQSRTVIDAFEEGGIVHAGDDVPSKQYVELASSMPALRTQVNALVGGETSPAGVASAVEFILEGLHLSKRLNKEAAGTRATYRGRSGGR